MKLKNHTANKFEFRWKGPYAIANVSLPGTYFLMEPSSQRFDNTVNETEQWNSNLLLGANQLKTMSPSYLMEPINPCFPKEGVGSVMPSSPPDQPTKDPDTD